MKIHAESQDGQTEITIDGDGSVLLTTRGVTFSNNDDAKVNWRVSNCNVHCPMGPEQSLLTKLRYFGTLVRMVYRFVFHPDFVPESCVIAMKVGLAFDGTCRGGATPKQ